MAGLIQWLAGVKGRVAAGWREKAVETLSVSQAAAACRKERQTGRGVTQTDPNPSLTEEAVPSGRRRRQAL